MHDRKVAIIKNKKCYISSDYVRNLITTYRGRNTTNYFNNEFFKRGLPQSIDVSKENPVTLYGKTAKRDLNIQNEVKKELADNYGILNNIALKYDLLKLYSLNNSNAKMNRNFEKYMRNKLCIDSDIFMPLDGNKRKLRINYSDKIRRIKYKSNLLKKNKSKLSVNNSQQRAESNDNKLDKNILTEEEYVMKLMGDKKYKKNNYMNNINILKKKQFLESLNISYENVDIKENEKNSEKEEKKKKKKLIFNEDGKYKKKPKPIKSPQFMIKKEKKKKNKISLNYFEYINKIKEEINNEKNKNNK
jgi:glutaredoxin